MRNLVRAGLAGLGSLLVLVALVLWVAPFGYRVDKFFRLFWWVGDYPVATILGSLVVGVIGGALIAAGVTMNDQPTVIPPPWNMSRRHEQ
ncbi:MAG: hypothetical protein UY71_C0005G0020 [Parcubacteria group bacterium GW2011_GWB1_52_7]|nr:MAG: hypothetical protein UY64_C0013G0014 [Parcubacteria group bacterium GW2011_GWA1_51_12]KKW29051.1 MAG: hypothetical protein UY71_C0005G0020 [Parcubacteria group bacterium GW2011_GWB1_52_7]KKW31325.1 MAG: hypothetical protein UY75_C0010G0012 [Parcubacteria group bacterium GW2011_GWC2_52_8c]